MIHVKATREGRVGYPTSIGYIVDRVVPFVALPSTDALRRAVRIQNPLNGKAVTAMVLDVGPWNEHDNGYVFQPCTRPGSLAGAFSIRPQAESGTDTFGRKTNGAGIDLGEYIWQALEMLDNGPVLWEFIEDF